LEIHQLDAINLSIAVFFLASANFCGVWIALAGDNSNHDAEVIAIESNTLEELDSHTVHRNKHSSWFPQALACSRLHLPIH